MKPQTKNNVSFYIYITSLRTQNKRFSFIPKFGWGCPDIFKSSTIFLVCFGLLTAQVFSKHDKHIESSNISMPGLLITYNKGILTLFTKT